MRAFRTHGHSVVRANAAESGAAAAEHRMNPGVPKDIVGLLHQSTAPGRTLVVCALALSAGEQGRRCYDAITALAAGHLTIDPQTGPIDEVLLTQAVYPVIGDESGDPALAALTGLARVLSMESPAIRIRVLDLPSANASALAEAAKRHSAGRTSQHWCGGAGVGGIRPMSASHIRRKGTTPWSRTQSGCLRRVGCGPSGRCRGPCIGEGRRYGGPRRPAGERDRTRRGPRQTNSGRQEPPSSWRPATLRIPCRSTCSWPAWLTVSAHSTKSSWPPASRETRPPAQLATCRVGEARTIFGIKVDGVAALAAASATYEIRRVVLMSSLAGVLGAISLGPYAAAAAAMDCCATRWNLRSTGLAQRGVGRLAARRPGSQRS